ncbi:MAG: hypothetical protein BroJett018_39870 [Chloroflexota bacterium]|nr:MAG: hypothetical protein BroJett018_39870 [Chloroflexota bacterium]
MGFKYGRNRLRPSEMDTAAVPIALIHAISTNTGQASRGVRLINEITPPTR